MPLHSDTRAALAIALLATLVVAASGLWLLRPMVRLGLVATGPAQPTGPWPVGELDTAVALKTATSSQTADVAVHLWYPRHSQSAAPDAPRPALVVYAPVWADKRTDNTAFTAALASQGFVVAAIDDIYNDPESLDASADDTRVRRTLLDFSGEDGRRRMITAFDRRLELSAAKVSSVLDALIANADRLPAAARFDPTRIGMAGASFGGATAVEAAARDTRIRAVLNLDGWLRGVAATRSLGVPLLNANSTRGMPDAAVLNAPDANPNHKFLAERSRETMAILERELNAPSGAVDITIAGASHGDYNNELYDQRRWMQWRPWRRTLIAPERQRLIVDAYATAFFARHLVGQPAPLLRQSPSPFPEVAIRLGPTRHTE